MNVNLAPVLDVYDKVGNLIAFIGVTITDALEAATAALAGAWAAGSSTRSRSTPG